MNKFRKIECKPNWKNIVSNLESFQSISFIRDDDNFLIAWDTKDELLLEDEFSFEKFEKFKTKNTEEYIFTALSYDIKNYIESSLISKNEDYDNFPTAIFFTTKNIFISNNGTAIYAGKNSDKDILELNNNSSLIAKNDNVTLNEIVSKNNYISSIEKIKDHLQRGDIYEMNYCVPFRATNCKIDPINTFIKLNNKSEAPFSVLLNIKDHSIISASPERFFKISNDIIYSQPIKGTAARGDNFDEDNKLKNNLKKDKKEIAENVMIVDLVRNDLSKIAKRNSVMVEELHELYSFRTVHQLISTISCLIKDETTSSEVIKALFPMGSMTGAPKVSAMQIADQLEVFQRGIYSGSIGYFEPNGNTDFNVIIRSLVYNRKKKTISAAVGGAITILSDPEQEYEECKLKLKALAETLC
ncbi:anthranilate synthase component I family protein [Paracrocinitomix mangrovi]|uniref:anthranilate synthase component I family protein n=1 Tax=Paracrocinitomix mangrovi TaxID=2862509 RepID=UPI001C8DCA1D|nr:anthranilate synthase component I family protein [Paracrocinitomix mangrovi]UKN03038.1 anthranilate synthase component I family protein [Paracrocinitomix mangrovi]